MHEGMDWQVSGHKHKVGFILPVNRVSARLTQRLARLFSLIKSIKKTFILKNSICSTWVLHTHSGQGLCVVPSSVW